MIRCRLDLTDLAATSFAYSPLQETVLSLRMWSAQAARLPHTRTMRTAFQQLDHELLTSLMARHRYWVPDLLTPRPRDAAPDIRTEFTALRAVDPALLAPDLQRTFLPLGEPVPPRLSAGLHDPAQLLNDIADPLEEYWHSCLLPWWPRIRSVLEADLAHRARVLAEHDAGRLFAGISERLTWAEGILTIQRYGPQAHATTDIPIDGRRLLLTPSCFADGVSTLLDVDARLRCGGRSALGESGQPAGRVDDVRRRNSPTGSTSPRQR